jgi:CO dehydrogenase/acetyl-CoA synthase gamma subunit (corrinoid Fe-S protein)
MPLADAYIDRIEFLKYLPQTDCGNCGAATCEAFVSGLKAGTDRAEDCPDVERDLYYPFQIALQADLILPQFPCLTTPRPGPTGLVEVNGPDEHSPVLISGNHVHTQDVLAAILGTTRRPFFLLFVDTKGDTVDMAVILNSLTPDGIAGAIVQSGIVERISHGEIVVPGLAAAMRDDLARATDLKVRVGPICAGELPLFFGASWVPPR